ncbi:divalent metal cation transporter [Adhaeretor mobilis]|uniref:Natural resistance-associated macrophage protein n=1 Tax=Adhaeretor mobilis TaxID=1930276 RepID=A0A517MSK3_9BACT|nr:divalent metal cation transporter [Adhaeretor mobilis]QDS97864.1 Natural resistance-associated macrophage protein [Adhaeretor mobilis]
MSNTPAPVDESVERDRQMLIDAEQKGFLGKLGTYTRLSGPGWLQSAITLGGGSLSGALFLGVLGGTSMLWLQLVAIIMGVVMLSAISYVTLSTEQRPFQLINQHVNPVLGWGWLIATCLANILWCMPQFSLCYEALEQNLASGLVGSSQNAKLAVSAIILTITSIVLSFNLKGGATAKVFDLFLKALIGAIVLCFFGVVIYLSRQGLLDWSAIFAGFIPDFSQWREATGDLRPLLADLPAEAKEFWGTRLAREQRAVMIGAAATAVGINMTFLLPYSMLQRGWGKSFRGLARFDLSTGMAIPYVLVTACVVIASAHAFHGQADEELLSSDPQVVQTSELFAQAQTNLIARVRPELAGKKLDELDEPDQQEVLKEIATLPEAEKRIAASFDKRNAFKLSKALAPLLGEKNANLVFGLGIFGMGFSTIIILMMINGFVFCEAFNKPRNGSVMVIGCLVAGVAGAAWPYVWEGPSKLWLAILVSSFGMMLLPIAYVTFFMLMNSKDVLGDDRPRGFWRWVWNLMMGASVIGALVAAATAIYDKITDHSSPKTELAGKLVLALLIGYLVAAAIGFWAKSKRTAAEH